MSLEDEHFDTEDSLDSAELNPPEDSSVEYSVASLPSNASPPYEPTSPAYSIASGEDADEESFFDDEDASTGSDFNPETATKGKMRKAYYSMFAKYHAVGVILDDYEERLKIQTARTEVAENFLQTQTRELYYSTYQILGDTREEVKSNTDQIQSMRDELGSIQNQLSTILFMFMRLHPGAIKDQA